MANPTRLNLLPYLQSWDGTSLEVRLVNIPRGSPLNPLIDGLTPPAPSFATAQFIFDVRLVQGLTGMATTTSPSSSVIITPAAVPQAETLFKQLAKQFQIDPAPPAPNPRPSGTQVRKYMPPTYRQAIGFSQARTPYVVSDDTYFCALKAPAPSPYVKIKPADPKMPWGKVIAMVMRQPVFSEALGLVRPFQVTPPSPDFFKEGGWLYVTLAPAGDVFALTTMPDAIKLYAARIPPLTAPQAVFTPVFFPVQAAPPPGPYDELFQEAIDYNDGFAKVVYAAQPQFTNPLSETDDGGRPVKDLGIRLGWDDEQVAIWMNRQIDPASAALDAPMGVQGYRVDGREAGQATWNSLCLAQGPVSVQGINVGSFNGELGIETIPAQLEGQKTGDYWLPIYYISWTGPSLVTIDILSQRLIGAPDPTDPNRVQGITPGLTLQYGKTYEFQVRLMDHTGGGPTNAEAPGGPSPQPVASLPFRRWVRPGAGHLIDPPPSVPDPSKPPTQLQVQRPLLSYPAYVFTGAPNAAADLLADLSNAKAESREVGLPDPDVTQLAISVEVEALGLDSAPGGGTDAGYHILYETVRTYPANPADPLVLDLDWQDVKNADTLAPGPVSGPLTLPTARNVRIAMRPVGRDDPQLKYFGAQDVRQGQQINVYLRHTSADERGLFVPDVPTNMIRGIFLQPDPPVDSNVSFAQRAAGNGIQAPNNALGRLADALGLAVSNLTLRGQPGRRVVFSASSDLRHILAPDASSITFASKSDLVQHWIIALRVTLDRDWTWDDLASQGISILRDGTGEVGRVEPRRMVNPDALIGPQRTQTDLVYFDAIDPKPEPGDFPAEIDLGYTLQANYTTSPTQSDAPLDLAIHLPITTRPNQVPHLVSAGIALSPYVRSGDYSRTDPRRKALWLEFDRPPDNPADSYYIRMLAYAPDPILVGSGDDVQEASEPPLPIDPEYIRVIVPGQSDDRAGASAMQLLLASDSPHHFMVPLPPGLEATSPELFGFFTYELRVGHASGWSTAQGRYGTALRVAGVQHPAPSLTCVVARNSTGIIASAPFADPVHNGGSLQPFPPATEMWVLIYAQVTQADGADHRNILLGRKPAPFKHRRFNDFGGANFGGVTGGVDQYGIATWSGAEIDFLLSLLTLDKDTPLSCLAVETLPGGAPLPDPLGANLGYQRLLRSSPLVPVPAVC
jgi:hypothetical protein